MVAFTYLALDISSVNVAPLASAQGVYPGSAKHSASFQPVLHLFDQPTAVRFAPDGRVFVAEKKGFVYAYKTINDPSTKRLVLDVRANLSFTGDTGIMSINVKPWPENPSLLQLFMFRVLNPKLPYIGRVSYWLIDGNSTVAGPEVVFSVSYCYEMYSHAPGKASHTASSRDSHLFEVSCVRSN